MPDLIYLFSKWRKPMLLLVLISVAIATAIVFIQQPQYLGTATAIVNSPLNADKGKIFNNQVEGLYSPLGSPDELDKIIGTAQLDTIYILAVQRLDLVEHYQLSTIAKAVTKLKKRTKIFKSEYGELKVKAWDTDRLLAPQIANLLLFTLDSIHTDLINEFNKRTLALLKQQANDSLSHSVNTGQYMALANEYQLTLAANHNVLSVTEPARVEAMPDRPKRLQVIAVVFVLSILFAIMLALVLERKAA